MNVSYFFSTKRSHSLPALVLSVRLCLSMFERYRPGCECTNKALWRMRPSEVGAVAGLGGPPHLWCRISSGEPQTPVFATGRCLPVHWPGVYLYPPSPSNHLPYLHASHSGASVAINAIGYHVCAVAGVSSCTLATQWLASEISFGQQAMESQFLLFLFFLCSQN